MTFRSEQVRLLYGGMPGTIFGSATVSLLLAAISWPVVDHVSIVSWLLLLAVLLAVRAWLYLRWRKRSRASDDPSPWLRRYRYSLIVSLQSWVCAGVLVFPGDDVVHQAFFALAVVCVAAASTNSLSADRFCAVTFVALVLGPAIVRLFLEGQQIPHAIGGLITLGLLFALANVQREHKRIREHFELHAEAMQQARRLQDKARELRESEAQLSAISANLFDTAIYRLSFSPAGGMKFTYISANAGEILGLPMAELRRDANIIFQSIDPEAVGPTKAAIAAYLRSGGPSTIEIPLSTQSGRRKWLRFHSRLSLRLPDGTQIRDGIAMDVTASREAEAQLEGYRQRLELALDAAKTCTWDNDIAANTITLDARWSVMLGGEPRQTRTTARALLRMVHPQDRAATFSAGAHIMEPANNDYHIEQRVRTHRNEWLWIECRGRVVKRRPNGRPLRIIGVNTDISAHKLAEENLEKRIRERTLALSESERRHRTLLSNLQGMAYRCLVDSRRTMQFVSEGSTRVLGVSPDDLVSGRISYAGFVHPDDAGRVAEAFSRALAERRPCQIEYRVRHADGSCRWVWEQGQGIFPDKGEPVAFEGYITDVTERVMLERQSNRAQRLESIGTLAGGIAHDLNNALAPILAGVGLLKTEHEDDDILDTIEESARRGADMVRRLLAFARGAESERTVIQPAACLGELERIIRSTFPKNIELVVATAPDVPLVRADATQIHQVLLNLCVNARDVMPHGGRLEIEVASVRRRPPPARQAPAEDVPVKTYVVFRVTDSGTGIPPEIIDRIFEPFFTTKPPDKGSGLGLSTALGITEAHGGFLEVSSTPGQGTIFSVFLPAEAGVAAERAPAQAAALAGGAGQAVLFVDDEPAVRTVMARLLEKMNFEPILAEGAREALARFDANREAIRAVITDMNMPMVDGLTFVRMLRERDSGVPVIVASGHLEDHVANDFRKLGVAHTLGKPFDLDDLATVLRATITPVA